MIRISIGIVVMFLVDRSIANYSWLFGARFIKVDAKTFSKRFGVFRFPRTLFAVCVAISGSIDQLVHVSQYVDIGFLVGFLIVYGIFAFFDVVQART
jgi:hypothetical protein